MIGVTEFIHSFAPEIDWDKRAKSKAKEKGVTPEEIQEEWEKKKELGKRLHKKRQDKYSSMENTFSFERLPGSNIPTEKMERLQDGTYLEMPIWTLRHGIIGYPDRVTIKKQAVHIEDYKTWEKVYRTGTVTMKGGKKLTEKMLYPLQAVEHCNFKVANLQLSLYMRIILDANPHLRFGSLTICHIRTIDEKEIGDEIIEVPYMREEINLLLKQKKITDGY